ncbi:Uu.00g009930.m01.CDS01 [Anthostomella pinea]|uniref:Uu.00g009930.m01.CDS01 n=1 Tax=Anthostomella pinea TaxID=933095 RepID=A0AAI8YPW9_9PEZI|nr:Uu.00g009930.m01.CDS01 [Anthostomella pinea]
MKLHDSALCEKLVTRHLALPLSRLAVPIGALNMLSTKRIDLYDSKRQLLSPIIQARLAWSEKAQQGLLEDTTFADGWGEKQWQTLIRAQAKLRILLQDRSGSARSDGGEDGDAHLEKR